MQTKGLAHIVPFTVIFQGKEIPWFTESYRDFQLGDTEILTERGHKMIDDFKKHLHDAFTSGYNSAIHDAASVTNSGMDNYQKIMGLLRK